MSPAQPPPLRLTAGDRRQIQERSATSCGLSCSIGIGPTKLLAKLAAKLASPAASALSEDDVHGRLRALPVGKLSGIGPVTLERLRGLGLTTIGRLQGMSMCLSSSSLISSMLQLSNGRHGGMAPEELLLLHPEASQPHAAAEPPETRCAPRQG